MMRPASLTTALALAFVVSAASARAADPQAPVPPGTTLLHVSATGTVQEAPDLLVAQLVAEASSANPATAQRQVNGRMQEAAHLADGVKSVGWGLADYAVQRSDDKQPVWIARQTMTLHGPDAPALLDLAGRLQAAGLAIADLSWTLSPARRSDAEARASDAALKALQHKAEAAAQSLGLKVGRIREVQLDERMVPRPMMRMMAKAEPQATPDAQDVSQGASADIELHP